MKREDKFCLVIAGALGVVAVWRQMARGPDIWVPVLGAMAAFFMICGVRRWRSWFQ